MKTLERSAPLGSQPLCALTSSARCHRKPVCSGYINNPEDSSSRLQVLEYCTATITKAQLHNQGSATITKALCKPGSASPYLLCRENLSLSPLSKSEVSPYHTKGTKSDLQLKVLTLSALSPPPEIRAGHLQPQSCSRTCCSEHDCHQKCPQSDMSV